MWRSCTVFCSILVANVAVAVLEWCVVYDPDWELDELQHFVPVVVVWWMMPGSPAKTLLHRCIVLVVYQSSAESICWFSVLSSWFSASDAISKTQRRIKMGTNTASRCIVPTLQRVYIDEYVTHRVVHCAAFAKRENNRYFHWKVKITVTFPFRKCCAVLGAAGVTNSFLRRHGRVMWWLIIRRQWFNHRIKVILH